MAKSVNVNRSLKIYLDGTEVKKSVAEIQKEMRIAQMEMKNAQIGSDNYRRALENLQTLKGILADHKAQLKETTNTVKELEKSGKSFFSEVKNWIKQGFFNKIGFDSFDALLGKLTQFRDLFNQKESSAANLKALTGLDDQSIQWLTDQAEQLSTTMDETGLRVSQTSQEILEAYMLVGSAKPELLSNKEALNAVTVEAMRLAQAAKMDLKDAVDGVTLALNQYGAGADEAARYVNVLAAGSKAGAADTGVVVIITIRAYGQLMLTTTLITFVLLQLQPTIIGEELAEERQGYLTTPAHESGHRMKAEAEIINIPSQPVIPVRRGGKKQGRTGR